MGVLVIGSGGRGDAVVWKRRQSARVRKVICVPGNGGIGRDVRCFPISPLDFASLSELVRQEQLDLVLVGSEAPLAAGVADHFAAAGTRALGPCKDAGRLEPSKASAKEV